jgi:hypothetical protein
MRRRVAQFYVESVAWGTGHAHGHLLTRCVLHRVGETFLDDPVRRTSHVVRQWAGGIEREIDRETRLAGALDQLWQVGERRLRQLTTGARSTPITREDPAALGARWPGWVCRSWRRDRM